MSNNGQTYFKQPSTMGPSHTFSSVPQANVPRSRFKRSSGHKTTMDAGFLTPLFVDEVLPGDTFQMSAAIFSRLSTPLKPFMDNLHADMHWWFVPNRLVFDHWPELMGENRDGMGIQPDDYTVPQTPWIAGPTHIAGSVAGYFGLPPVPGASETVPTTRTVSALPFRALALIFNTWYRDENLVPPIPVDFGDGPDDWSEMLPPRRGKRKDYFTSALPWPQKGDPVLLPLVGTAPLVGMPPVDFSPSGVANPYVRSQVLVNPSDDSILGTLMSGTVGGGQRQPYASYYGGGTTGDVSAAWDGQIVFPSGAPLVDLSDPSIYADLSNAGAATLNDFRLAEAVQRFFERDARGGTRYIEKILSHFGVTNPDFRLQRPELLGEGSGFINVNPIASTVAATGGAPQANLAAVGTGVWKSGFTHSFTEHGFIIGLCSIWADLTYQRSLLPLWTRKTQLDHYFPEFAHLGEQPVYNREIFFQDVAGEDDTEDDGVWGYQEAWASYRYRQSQISGRMASTYPQSLDFWHLSQDFENSMPHLNQDFIEEHPPVDRVIAVPSEPQFLIDAWFDLTCTRAMPIYSVPGLSGTFS